MLSAGDKPYCILSLYIPFQRPPLRAAFITVFGMSAHRPPYALKVCRLCAYIPVLMLGSLLDRHGIVITVVRERWAMYYTALIRKHMRLVLTDVRTRGCMTI
jgi:hypothetical protein